MIVLIMVSSVVCAFLFLQGITYWFKKNIPLAATFVAGAFALVMLITSFVTLSSVDSLLRMKLGDQYSQQHAPEDIIPYRSDLR